MQKGVQTFRFAHLWCGKSEGLHSKVSILQQSQIIKMTKILIVDDQPQNLFALEKLLTKLNIEIIQAKSGNEALGFTLLHDFALAIVDVQMPEMDGYELVELLRGNPLTKHIPVIFISAIYADEFHYRRGYESGAVDFLPKPFIPEILLSKVQIFLELYQQRLRLQSIVTELDLRNQELEHEIQQRQQMEDGLRTANKTLSKLARQLEANNRLAIQITSTLDLDELLEKSVNLIQSRFDYYFVGVWLLVDNETLANIRRSLGANLIQGSHKISPDEAILQVGFRADGTYFKQNQAMSLNMVTHAAGQVYLTRRFYLLDDLETVSNYIKFDFVAEARSVLALPLQFGAQFMGVLEILSDKVENFTFEDGITLQTLAHKIAIAIHNAQLFSLTEQTNQELAKLNLDKDKFFSIVAHDLKSPFMPLLGNAEMLMEMVESLKPADVKRMSQSIYRSAKQVLELLENLLTWARFQMGRMECVPEELKLYEIGSQVIELLKGVAEVKKITLCNDVPATLFVQADKNMLATIIRNLTNNAIKFTKANGTVTLLAKQQNEWVEIAIADTGVGIKPENLTKLFKIEVNPSTMGTAKEAGTGLGLLICQEMVEVHGGHIWVESEFGQGTMVKFTVPRGTQA